MLSPLFRAGETEARKHKGWLEAGQSSMEEAWPEAARSCAAEAQCPLAEEEPKEAAERTGVQLAEDPGQYEIAGSGRAR